MQSFQTKIPNLFFMISETNQYNIYYNIVKLFLNLSKSYMRFSLLSLAKVSLHCYSKSQSCAFKNSQSFKTLKINILVKNHFYNFDICGFKESLLRYFLFIFLLTLTFMQHLIRHILKIYNNQKFIFKQMFCHLKAIE